MTTAKLDSEDEIPDKISQNKPTRQHRIPDHFGGCFYGKELTLSGLGGNKYS